MINTATLTRLRSPKPKISRSTARVARHCGKAMDTQHLFERSNPPRWIATHAATLFRIPLLCFDLLDFLGLGTLVAVAPFGQPALPHFPYFARTQVLLQARFVLSLVHDSHLCESLR